MTAIASKFEGFLALNFPKNRMSDQEFFEFCQLNQELKIERNSNGEIIIMSPTGTRTGARNARLTIALGMWNLNDNQGEIFDSSTGFKLPNGATYGPDAAWMTYEKWNALTPEEQEGFAPVVPDFIAEIRSKSDSLKPIQEKIAEFLACGCKLAWLIDPILQKTTVYQADGTEVEVTFDQTLTGGSVLPGFEVIIAQLFQ
jgi:Uma2 family endonuclease